jgi:hypothetical protein
MVYLWERCRMVIYGTYRRGQVVLDQLPELADGTRLRIEEVEAQQDEARAQSAPTPEERAALAFGQQLLELAGSCPDLPPDIAENHDHYLYGGPKKVEK